MVFGPANVRLEQKSLGSSLAASLPRDLPFFFLVRSSFSQTLKATQEQCSVFTYRD